MLLMRPGLLWRFKTRVAASSAQKLVEEASKLAATVETGNLKPIVHIAAVDAVEDNMIHLVAITGGGARLYLTTSSRYFITTQLLI